MGTFWCTFCFLAINPLETRIPFCWKICNADFNLPHYPNLGEAKPIVMPNDLEMIKLVRTTLLHKLYSSELFSNCFVQLLVVSLDVISILKMLMRMENQWEFSGL